MVTPGTLPGVATAGQGENPPRRRLAPEAWARPGRVSVCPQELFQKCHPVHFLNSRALGVTDKSAALPR